MQQGVDMMISIVLLMSRLANGEKKNRPSHIDMIAIRLR